MKRLLAMACGLVALVAGVASAGTPLPDPPFSGGGFVPPDSVAYKLEYYVGRMLVKYSKNTRKCDYKAVLGLQLAYEPQNAGKVPEVQAAWQLCKDKVSAKYAAERDKLILQGTPTCLDQAGIDAIRAAIDANLAAVAPTVFCDDDAAAPDPVTGLNIPDFKNEASGEADVAKVLTKLDLYSYKCYLAALRIAFGFGTIPPEYMGKITGCFAKVEARSDDAMGDLDQQQKLPDCLPLATALAEGDAAIAFQGTLTDSLYCASPSGAFLD
jgi:hypothetical protein